MFGVRCSLSLLLNDPTGFLPQYTVHFLILCPCYLYTLICQDLLPVHRSYPARQVPVTAVPGVHDDAVVFTCQYSAFYVPHDTTIVRLRTVTRKIKTNINKIK